MPPASPSATAHDRHARVSLPRPNRWQGALAKPQAEDTACGLARLPRLRLFP